MGKSNDLLLGGKEIRPQQQTNISPPTPPPPPPYSTPNGSIRRMRKKELLRQYWENMDDGNAQKEDPNAATSTTNNGRNGTPKSDNGMSSQQKTAEFTPMGADDPTRPDLQSSQMSTSYITPPPETQTYNHKKRKMPANRELRQLEVPSYNEEAPERHAGTGSNGGRSSDDDEPSKRITRTKQPPMLAPKLKIKIGPDVMEPSGSGDSGRARPPKKRLSNIATVCPSLEEIRRDSMNFRKQVISQFNEDQPKPKKSKDKDKDKTKGEKSKHKKKKNKDKDKDKDMEHHEVKIVNDTNSSKLIIRFAKRKAEVEEKGSSDEAVASSSGVSKVKASDTNPPSPSGSFIFYFLNGNKFVEYSPNRFLMFYRILFV